MGPNAEITDPHTTGDHWQHVFLLCNKHVTVTKTDGWSVDLLLLPPQQSHTFPPHSRGPTGGSKQQVIIISAQKHQGLWISAEEEDVHRKQ